MVLGAACGMTRYQKGDVVYLPGDHSQIYLLKMGSVKLVSQSDDGKELIKEIIETGEVFGKYISGVDPEGGEQAVALNDCMVCYLPFDRWEEFVKDNLSLNIKITKWVGLRISRLERKMHLLYFKDVDTRLIDVMNDLAERVGKEDSLGNIIINLRLTHDELSQLTGASRQSITSLLTDLRDKGFIDYSRSNFILKPKWRDKFLKKK